MIPDIKYEPGEQVMQLAEVIRCINQLEVDQIEKVRVFGLKLINRLIN